MVDEAHAVFGTEEQVDIIMGTLSKALGSTGGFIAGSKLLIDYLRNKARSFIYTTALAPASCAAALAAIEIIEQNPNLIEKLRKNIQQFTHLPHASPIIPILIGDAKQTMEISNKLFDRGFFVSAIRPPTVPKGQSRLRITISAAHSEEEISKLLSVLRKIMPPYGPVVGYAVLMPGLFLLQHLLFLQSFHPIP
ncbi:MAG: 8-amino-7-oxononanoate synthase [Candidatus Saganbacteria bacterium]|uniref:8-amino-7-oxononanoate synthase n=1 Tax=Candidatus Saganbacteria bacterium TaxID=2575572 RepID=A0A833KZV2_UNCSA|nr:MAG: 8-amino-7-oxononanoate synthase [Candidatus Saganbacteria bacterium]